MRKAIKNEKMKFKYKVTLLKHWGSEKLKIMRGIATNIFETLVNLEYISISNNHIEELNSNLFHGLVNLKSIFLDRNEIKELHPNLFKELIKLKYFDFSHNKIEKLATNLFDGLLNLRFDSNNLANCKNIDDDDYI